MKNAIGYLAGVARFTGAALSPRGGPVLFASLLLLPDVANAVQSFGHGAFDPGSVSMSMRAGWFAGMWALSISAYEISTRTVTAIHRAAGRS